MLAVCGALGCHQRPKSLGCVVDVDCGPGAMCLRGACISRKPASQIGTAGRPAIPPPRPFGAAPPATPDEAPIPGITAPVLPPPRPLATPPPPGHLPLTPPPPSVRPPDGGLDFRHFRKDG